MSTINVAKFESELVEKIRNTTDNKDLAILNKALSVLKTGAIFSVNSFSDLPTASDSIGKLYLVKNDNILYFAYKTDYGDVYYWIPITNISVNALFSWGCNNGFQLGNGESNTVDKLSPGTVAGKNDTWVNISAHSLNAPSSAIGLKSDGTIWTWGTNTAGQLGNGNITQRCSPGTVWGNYTTWCQVSGGQTNTAAIKTDGTIWTWGCNSQGQLGDGTTVDRCSPGTVWGSYTTWCQVSFGFSHSSAIKTDGTLWTWGCASQGRLGDGTTVSRCSPGTIWGGGTTWCQVFNGFCHTLAIKTDGTLWTWGTNGLGELGNGTTVSRCSPGTVWGSYTTWSQVSGGMNNTAAIKTDGTLWTWGCNGAGVLGDGTTINRCSPGTIAGGGTTWCQVGTICQTSAIKTDGTLWTWGCNTQGRLGDGTQTNRCSPGTVAGGGTTWFETAVGSNFMLAITKETL